MRLLALDLSLTRTGVAECASDEPIATYNLQTVLRGQERLRWLRDCIVHRATRVSPRADVIAIEGYSFGSKFTQAHALGELGGVVRLGLHEAEVIHFDIPPANVKKYATGAGNAAKEQVMAAAARRADRDFACHDEADAWWIAQMLLANYCPEHPDFVVLPAKNQEGLRRVSWPELAERVA